MNIMTTFCACCRVHNFTLFGKLLILYTMFSFHSLTFLFGECITGAGGEGGPLGIFLFVLEKETKRKQNIEMHKCPLS